MTDSVDSAVRAHLDRHIGGPDATEPSVASVTFLGVEPIDVLRYPGDDTAPVRYATLGCSRHPMGDPSEMIADPTRGPRAELVLSLTGGAGVASGVHKTLAVLAAAPSVEGVVLRPDGLIDLGEPLWKGAPFTAVLLGPSGIPDLALPEPLDPVQFLEVAPLTGTEAAWVRLRGAAALREAWAEAGIDVRDPNRGAAAL
ncbi:suppressor of fused domain protein [Prescottella agglutinans]|uniref:Suppressor of fused domain protein n=1 Tax=Prescottella agglutinans TaxID=1644129 RepID=A0A438BHA0_9NOCA|nr:suppressor of fused domain protein [Prescottella agglutinans]RVW10416.1 suppressor of fused domain protein [Prescottella agglutinans]